MHAESFELMRWALADETRIPHRSHKSVADVGSFDVNGTYRPLIESLGFKSYTGLDVREGPGVDLVIDPARDDWRSLGSFDVIITGQTMEHTSNPFRFCKQLRSMSSSRGIVVVVAPWVHPLHFHPVDSFRILPDGIRSIFKSAGFHTLFAGTTEYRESGNGDLLAIGSVVKGRPEAGEVTRFPLVTPAGVGFLLRVDIPKPGFIY